MSSTIRRQAVVPPSWVHDLVGGGSPLAYPGHGFVILEVGCGEPDAYLRGHVPGAVYLDTNLIERPPLWHFVPDAELQAVLELDQCRAWICDAGEGHDITGDLRVDQADRGMEDDDGEAEPA